MNPSAKSAAAWAILVVHPINGRLYNLISDEHAHGPLWMSVPLVVIDTYEHAFYIDYQNKRLAELEKGAEAAHRKIHLAGINCESHTLVGPPKQTLLEWAESWKADCIFVGASGTQHPGAEAFGTVASAISVRAHCSVEIARNRPAEIIANGPAL